MFTKELKIILRAEDKSEVDEMASIINEQLDVWNDLDETAESEVVVLKETEEEE